MSQSVSAADEDTITALLVVDVPPPIPSTWRGSGLPNSRNSTLSFDQPGTSSWSLSKTQHLLVPPRIQVAAMSVTHRPLHHGQGARRLVRLEYYAKMTGALAQ